MPKVCSVVMRALLAVWLLVLAGTSPAWAQPGGGSSCRDQRTLAVKWLMVREDRVLAVNVTQCNPNDGFPRFYRQVGGGGTDFSRELTWAANYRANEIMIIDMAPGEWAALPAGSAINRYLETSVVTMQSLPRLRWSSLSVTLPFLPSAVYDGGGGLGMLGGLRVIPELAGDFDGMTFDSSLISIHGIGFMSPSDFLFLSNNEYIKVQRVAFLIYMTKGDPVGQIRVKLARATPVSAVSASFNTLASDLRVAAVPDNADGQRRLALLGMMSGLAAAYDFYNSSGMAEEDRQACAAWRANGASPATRPLRSC